VSRLRNRIFTVLPVLCACSLTVGSAVGSIRDIFSKINGINAKHGKFDLVLCLGDFFGPVKEDGTGSEEVSQLLNGEIEGMIYR
jgi:hypothetical protein